MAIEASPAPVQAPASSKPIPIEAKWARKIEL